MEKALLPIIHRFTDFQSQEELLVHLTCCPVYHWPCCITLSAVPCGYLQPLCWKGINNQPEVKKPLFPLESLQRTACPQQDPASLSSAFCFPLVLQYLIFKEKKKNQIKNFCQSICLSNDTETLESFSRTYLAPASCDLKQNQCKREYIRHLWFAAKSYVRMYYGELHWRLTSMYHWHRDQKSAVCFSLGLCLESAFVDYAESSVSILRTTLRFAEWWLGSCSGELQLHQLQTWEKCILKPSPPQRLQQTRAWTPLNVTVIWTAWDELVPQGNCSNQTFFALSSIIWLLAP